jgi:hypothetical protein
MNGTGSSTICVGTRIGFDGGLWEVAEMTATGVVLRDALGGVRQVSISPPARQPRDPPAGRRSRAACPSRSRH